jgi:hypothetical protein
MQEEKVSYDKTAIIQILRDLEVLVVSTDRIGSASYADYSEDQYNAMFLRFFDECGFAKKLAVAREVLSEPFPYEAGEDGMDELERNFQDLKFWPENEQ